VRPLASISASMVSQEETDCLSGDPPGAPSGKQRQDAHQHRGSVHPAGAAGQEEGQAVDQAQRRRRRQEEGRLCAPLNRVPTGRDRLADVLYSFPSMQLIRLESGAAAAAARPNCTFVKRNNCARAPAFYTVRLVPRARLTAPPRSRRRSPRKVTGAPGSAAPSRGGRAAR